MDIITFECGKFIRPDFDSPFTGELFENPCIDGNPFSFSRNPS